MSDVDANIRIDVQTAQAQAQLRALQAQVVALNKAMVATQTTNLGATGQGLAKVIPSLSGYNNEIVNITQNYAKLDKALAGGSRRIGESFKTFTRAIRGTGDEMILAQKRAQALHTEFRTLSRGFDGSATAIKSVPLNQMASRFQVFQQQTSIALRAMDQFGTSVLNMGKNMQWAGRQMMVGLTVPLTIFGAVAIKTFSDLERQMVNFRRVYGDFTTSSVETEAMTKRIRDLAVELTKYGQTARDTIELAADAAATGTVGEDLVIQVEQATRLATLGMISQQQALDTMISLNTAFKIQGDELEDTVNFLNAVENQTVLALADVTEAIPLVAPVIQGLGGDVKDLAVLLTAMREGGIGANEAANALKTSLARLITPTKQAKETAAEFGINLKRIVQENEGDLMGMIMDLSYALEGLSELQKQQVMSDLFGKRQFARMGALFSNIADEAGQAQKVIDLTAESTENLAYLADKELSAVEESAGMRFTAMMEQFKVAIAPIGELITKLILPIGEVFLKILNWFNDLDKNIQAAAVGIIAFLGAIVPVFVMLSGVVFNFIGSMVNGAKHLIAFGLRMSGLVQNAQYLTIAQLEAQNEMDAMALKSIYVESALESQGIAVANLTQQYYGLQAAMAGMPSGVASPIVTGPAAGFASGGSVPGVGNDDRIPAVLTPGEFVVKKDQATKHRGFLNALNAGVVKGLATGTRDIVGAHTGALRFGGYSDVVVPIGNLASSGQSASEALEAVTRSALGLAEGQNYLTQKQADRIDGLQAFDQRLQDVGSNSRVTMGLKHNSVLGLSGSVNEQLKTGVGGSDFLKHMAQQQDNGELLAYTRAQLGEGIPDHVYAAYSQALVDQTAKLSENAIVVDTITDEMRESGLEYVELQTIVDAAKEQIRQAGPEFEQLATSVDALEHQVNEARVRVTNWSDVTDEQIAEMNAIDPDYVYGVERGAKRDKDRLHIRRRNADGSAGDLVFSGRPSQGEKTILGSRTSRAGRPYTQVAGNLDENAQALRESTAATRRDTDATRKKSAATERATAASQASTTAARKEQAVQDKLSASLQQKVNLTARDNMTSAQLNQKIRMYISSLDRNQRAQLQAAISAGKLNEAQIRAALGMNQLEAASKKASGGMLAFGNKAMMGVGVLAGVATMGSSMIPGMEKFTGQIGMASMAMGMLPMMLGSAGPVGWAIAGLVAAMGAAAFALYDFRKRIDNASKEAMKTGADLGNVSNQRNVLMELGVSTPSIEDRLFRFSEEDRKAMEEFGKFFEGEEGQKLVEELRNATDEERYRKLNALLREAVAKGMPEEKAKLFGQSVAMELGDALLNSRIAADFGKQMFESGAAALIEIERERMGNAPDPRAAAPRSSQYRDLSNNKFAQAATASIVGNLLIPGVGGAIATAMTGLQDKLFIKTDAFDFRPAEAFADGISKINNSLINSGDEVVAKTEAAASSLGFGMEQIARLGEAEEMLRQERADGTITAEEYASSLAEIRDLQKQNRDALMEAYNIEGIDTGGLAQGMKSFLALRGFEGEMLAEVEKILNPEELSRQMFGKEFADLNKAQQEYISVVLQEVTAGLTPENAAQRMQDVRTIWTNIADEALIAMSQGLDATTAARNMFSEDQFADYLGRALYDESNLGTPDHLSSGRQSDISAKNLTSMNDELEQMGTSAMEVVAVLTSFSDTDMAKSVVESTDNIELLGKAMTELGDTGLDVEAIMQTMFDQGYGADTWSMAIDEMADAMERIEDTEFSKGTFGKNFKEIENNAISAKDFMNVLVATGDAATMSAAEMEAEYNRVLLKLDELADAGDVIKTETGSFKINAALVTTMFGSEVPNPSALVKTLNDALPAGLDPIDAQILVSVLGNDPVSAALLANPAILEAVMAGKTSYKQSGYQAGSGGYTRDVEIQNEAIRALAKAKSSADNAKGMNPTKKPENKGSSGGGDDAASWLQEQFEQAAENQAIRKRRNKLIKENSKLNAEAIEMLSKDVKALAEYEELVDYYTKKTGSKRKGRRKAEEAVNKAVAKNIKADEYAENRQIKREKKAKDAIDNDASLSGATYENAKIRDLLKEDKELMELYLIDSEAAIKIAKQRVEAEATVADRLEYQYDLLKKQYKQVKTNLELQKYLQGQAAESEIEDLYGKSVERAEVENDIAQKEIAYIQASQIQPLEDKIDKQEDYIDLQEEEIDKIDDVIKGHEKEVDLKQRKVAEMQREIEMIQRESEMLSHDLKLMGYQEEQISEVYDKRIAALDEVLSINEAIAAQQQAQLGLADALSRGDIGAAAQAAQQMQQQQMQFAADQYRNQLEINKENAINNLTGVESGLTKDQITERQREIEEDIYQRNLQIRVVEDEIYNLNQQITAEKDKQLPYVEKIETAEKLIRDHEKEIRDIENGRIATLEGQIAQNDIIIKQAEWQVAERTREADVQLALLEEQEQGADLLYEAQSANLELQEAQGDQIKANTHAMVEFGKAAAAAYNAIETGSYHFEADWSKFEKAQAKSNAHEANMRKHRKELANMQSSYAVTSETNRAIIEGVKQGLVSLSGKSATFGIPTTAVPQAAVNGIMGNVTNNYNNNNVNVNAANANAYEVAQIVLREINLQEGRNVK